MQLHIFHHHEVKGVDRMIDLLESILMRETRTMTTVQQIKDQADKVLAAVQAESDKDDAIIALVEGNTKQISDLKQQLADAINNGSDPAALQAVLDNLTAAETSALANAQKVTEAVNANTDTPATDDPNPGSGTL